MKKKRLLEFDVLRGFAFIFVILQHTFGGYSNRENISDLNFFISKFIYEFSKIAVPIFVLLTGIGLYYSHKDKFDLKDFYIRKMKFLVLPYIFFSLFILYKKDTPMDSDLIWILLSGDAQYHLWYMAMIIRIYLFFPIIYYIVKFINKQNKYISLLSFPVFYILYTYVFNIYKLKAFVQTILFKNPGDLQSRFLNVSPLFYIDYLLLGIFIISNYEGFKKIILKYKYYIVCIFIMLFSQNYYLVISKRIGNPFTFIVSTKTTSALFKIFTLLFMYLAAYYISEKLKYLSKVLIFISKYSYPAYLIHVYILNTLSCKMAITADIECTLRLFMLTFSYSIYVSFLLSCMPFAKYIVGCKSKLNLSGYLIKILD